MLHHEAKSLVNGDIILISGFQIGRQTIPVGALKPQSNCRAAKALALKLREASGIMEVPERLVWQMPFNQIRDFQSAND